MCVPAWRFARRDRPAAGLGTREQLLGAYERHSGVAVDPAALSWWELAGTLRWGVICVMQAFSHLSGARRSVEHAVIGRRACEVEWDLLELLGVPLDEATAGRSAPSSAQPAALLHDRPTAIELLHAAREALGDDVLPQLDGRAAFQLRVVLRALGIVGRELEHSAEHTEMRAAALASARRAPTSASWPRAIREGGLQASDPRVLAACATPSAPSSGRQPGYLNLTNPATEDR